MSVLTERTILPIENKKYLLECMLHRSYRVHYKGKLYFKIQTEINNTFRAREDILELIKICIALII